MDTIDKEILKHLQTDARLSMTAIGKRVNLSQPAVTERIKRLEEQEIIDSYQAVINHEKIGKPLVAFIMFRTYSCDNFLAFCETCPEISECHRISGEYNYLIKAVVSETKAIERLENELIPFGCASTLVSLSSPIPSKILLPEDAFLKH